MSLPTTPHASADTSLSSDVLPLDMEQMLRRCMGRADFAERLLSNFEARFPLELGQIEACLAAGDLPKFIQLAHQLKGASANMSAPHLTHLLQSIEAAARAGVLTDVPSWLNQLHHEWQRFLEFRRRNKCRPESNV